MIITYYGLACFKLQSGNLVLATDPFSKDSGLVPPRFQADVVLSTQASPFHANTETLTGSPFIITTPGEYEIKGISIEGVPVNSAAYVFEWDGIRFCHLGALSKKSFTEEIKEVIGTPDVLFVPVGGGESLDAEEAVDTINQIEPRIVIPMYYQTKGLRAPTLSGPELFLKEFGSSATPEDKFVFKQKDVPQEETKLVFLKAATEQ